MPDVKLKLELDALDKRTLRHIRQRGTVERNDLCKTLGVSYPTVIRTLSDLSNQKCIENSDNRTVSISQSNGRVFWGISIGTSHVKICLLSFSFAMIESSVYEKWIIQEATRKGFDLVTAADMQEDQMVDQGKYLCYNSPKTYEEFRILLNLVLDAILAFSTAQEELGQYITAGIGFAFSGAVDKSAGILKKAINIQYLEDVSLMQIIPPITQQELKRREIALVFDHNAKAAAVAEKEALFSRIENIDQNRNVIGRNMLCFYLGTGIGAGLVLDNRLYTGTLNYAGEISHFPVYFAMSDKDPLVEIFENYHCDSSYYTCSCGNKNCFEKYIRILDCFLNAVAEVVKKNSSTKSEAEWIIDTVCEEKGEAGNISEQTKKILLKGIPYQPESDREELYRCMVAKIETAYQLLGHLIGYAITAMVNILNIDTVICTGRLTQYYQRIERYILEQTSRNGVSYTRNCCSIFDSTHGKLAPAVGIAIESYYAFTEDSLDWNI